MIRLVPLVFAGAAFAVPVLASQERAVAAIGLVGLLLAMSGIIGSWRWPITGAAGAFLLAYAVALLVADPPPSIAVSAGLGLAIFLLLQSADLAFRTRRTAADLTVLLVQFGRWILLGGGVLMTAVLGLGLAAALAASLPAAASPFLAAAGALGIVISIAAIVARAARARARGSSASEE
jgi:hypothetical protein